MDSGPKTHTKQRKSIFSLDRSASKEKKVRKTIASCLGLVLGGRSCRDAEGGQRGLWDEEESPGHGDKERCSQLLRAPTLGWRPCPGFLREEGTRASAPLGFLVPTGSRLSSTAEVKRLKRRVSLRRETAK